MTITESASHKVLNCATPVSGKATSALPTAWTSGLPFTPFKGIAREGGLIEDFCDSLVENSYAFYPGIPDSLHPPPSGDKLTVAQCFHGNEFEFALFKDNFTIALAFDADGCDKNDKYSYFVDMTKYGKGRCMDQFYNNIIKPCKFTGFGLIENSKTNNLQASFPTMRPKRWALKVSL